MRYLATKDVLFQSFENEGILLNLATAEYYRLNELGLTIWSLVERGHDVDAITDSLLETYDVAREQIRTDLTRFLDQLVELKLARLEP
ncbi:MAG: PqqD family protein [Gemmataceae bacterium]